MSATTRVWHFGSLSYLSSLYLVHHQTHQRVNLPTESDHNQHPTSNFTMPLHRIYAPKDFFSREEKKQLVNDIADMYIAVGLPPFLVITLFIPVDAEEDFYIGKQSHSERAKEQGKPFVRIVSQHLARTAEGKERRMTTIKKLEDRYRGVLEAKNCEWEVSTATTPRNTERHTDSCFPW